MEVDHGGLWCKVLASIYREVGGLIGEGGRRDSDKCSKAIYFMW